MGAFSSELIKLKGEVDILLGSDVFYDPVVFEDLLCTVSYILESNPSVCLLISLLIWIWARNFKKLENYIDQ